MKSLLPVDRPVLVLAPMQDVTDLPFMRVMARFGGPDFYVTEYFRVHVHSKLEPRILKSITENETGRPVFAQLIGQDIPALVRAAKELEEYPVAGIDLNLGCPAPVVCRKDAGGGLLRNLEKLEGILGALREAIGGRFTVKTRVGYESAEEFAGLLKVFGKHGIDALTIHGRTVRERYQTPVHPECLRAAVEVMNCPVIANGNVVNVATGQGYLERTGAAGLMIGRGAIRNPWIFEQLRAAFTGGVAVVPTRRNLQEYIELLYRETEASHAQSDPLRQVQKMKRYLVYIAQGLEEDFEFRMRRVKTEEEFFAICRDFLSNEEALPDWPEERSKLFCGFGALVR
jgi:tRNA-dihydrouridine synthase